MQTQRVQREEMLALASKILRLVGTFDADAMSVAESLVQAQESGHASHGVMRLIEYTEFVQQGLVIPTAQPKVISNRGSVATIDGQRGWGQIACKQAVDLATDKAKSFGIAAIALKSCNHIGRLGEYVEILASRNLVSVMCCNAGPAVAPFGGKTRVFGTNPFAAGVPRAGSDIIIDFATAGTAEGKLRIAHTKGIQVQTGLIIDKDGQESIEPADFYDGGSLLPFGGHKGYCLSLLIEMLGGGLSGNHPSMNDLYTHGNGTILMVMDPDFFVGFDNFSKDVNEASQVIKNSPPVNPELPILLPGEVENQNRADNKSGIEIVTSIWNSINKLEKSLMD